MKHMFDVDIATAFGVNAAIIFENLGFWVEYNRANRTNFRDGKYWTFNSRKALRELFPYMGEKQLRSATSALIDAGLVETGNFNDNPYDRTLWYTLSDKGYSTWQKDKSTFGEKTNGKAQKGRPIPDINTDIKPDKETVPSGTNGKSKPEKKVYGEYQNVRLTDEELDKLKAEFPDDWQDRIENLSEYMASKGSTYKNHLATIRNWNRMEQRQKSSKNGSGIPDDDPYAGYDYRW